MCFRNGRRYSGEIHFVHVNAASTQIAVLGIFLQSKPSVNATGHRRRKRETGREVSSTNNATLVEWDKYLDVTDDLNQTNATTMISLKLTTLMGDNLDRFYRYQGALTVPPCNEFVNWTVFEKPLVFDGDELEAFRTYLFTENFREPQPLNGRIVYRNFVNATMSNISDYQCCGNSPVTTTSTPSSTSSIYRRSISMMNMSILIYSALFIVVSFLFI